MSNARNSHRDVARAGRVANSPDKEAKGSSPEAKQHARDMAKINKHVEGQNK